MDSSTLIPALVASRNHRRPLTEEEKALAELNERPNAPNLPAGMSLDSITQNTEVPVSPRPEPVRTGGNPLQVDMEAVRATHAPAPPGPRSVELSRPGMPDETIALSQGDLAERYADGAGPEKPTKPTSWEESMAAAKLAEEQVAEEQVAEEEPPPEPQPEQFPEVPEDMESQMRAELNNPVKPEPEPDPAIERARLLNPAQEQSEASKRRSAKLRRQNLITSWAARTGLSRSEVADLYDQGAAEAGDGADTHKAGIDAIVTSDARFNAEHNDLEQRKANVMQRANQGNRARRQGIPVGMVMAIDEINNAQDDRSMMQAMVNASAVYPQFRPMVAAVAQGQISANALKARLLQSQMQYMSAKEVAALQAGAEAEKNKDPVDRANERAKDAAFTPQGINDVVLTSSQLGHDDETAATYLANTYSEPMNNLADSMLAGESPDPQELSAMKQVMMRYTGGNLPTSRDMVALFGRRSPEEMRELADMLFGESGVRNLTMFGNAIGAVEDVGDWVGGFFS